MKYCSFRLNWGSYYDGKYHKYDIVVDGQMDIPSNNKLHLNWKELHNFKTDFDGAWAFLTTLLGNANDPNTIAYFGCKGYRNIADLEAKYEDYKKFYIEEVLGQ